MEGHVQKRLFSPFPSGCWHIPLTPFVVLVSSLVGIDSFKGSKCMFETVFDLSAGGIIMQKTLLHLSGKGERGAFQVTHLENSYFQALFRSMITSPAQSK